MGLTRTQGLPTFSYLSAYGLKLWAVSCNRFAVNFDIPTGRDRLSAARKLSSAKEAAQARGVVDMGRKRLVFGFHGYRRRPGSSQVALCTAKRDHANLVRSLAVLGLPNRVLARSVGSLLSHFHFWNNAPAVHDAPDRTNTLLLVWVDRYASTANSILLVWLEPTSAFCPDPARAGCYRPARYP
jgi:hypothetical protein